MAYNYFAIKNNLLNICLKSATISYFDKILGRLIKQNQQLENTKYKHDILS